jgi:hypothetical protein
MRDAKDNVLLVAGRRAIDTRLIDVQFDAGRGPGPHRQHVLVISIRSAPIAVSEGNIPHEWFPIGTGFIDTRFSHLITGMLKDLLAKAHQAGVRLDISLPSAS